MPFCPNCGTPNTEQADKCVACGFEFEVPKQKAKFRGTIMMSGIKAPALGSPVAPPDPAPTPSTPPAPAPASSVPSASAPTVPPASSPSNPPPGGGSGRNLSYQRTILGPAAGLTPPSAPPPRRDDALPSLPPPGAPARIPGEPSRVSGEPSRVAAEPSRVTGEPSRISGEPSRVSGEPSRVSGEPSRVSGEPSRVAAEPSRVSGEPSRVAPEPSRPNEPRATPEPPRTMQGHAPPFARGAVSPELAATREAPPSSFGNVPAGSSSAGAPPAAPPPGPPAAPPAFGQTGGFEPSPPPPSGSFGFDSSAQRPPERSFDSHSQRPERSFDSHSQRPPERSPYDSANSSYGAPGARPGTDGQGSQYGSRPGFGESAGGPTASHPGYAPQHQHSAPSFSTHSPASSPPRTGNAATTKKPNPGKLVAIGCAALLVLALAVFGALWSLFSAKLRPLISGGSHATADAAAWRASISTALEKVTELCAVNCEQASVFFHPEVQKQLLGEARSLTVARVQKLSDASQSEALMLDGTDDEEIAEKLALDPQQCARIATATAKVISCSVPGEGGGPSLLRIVHLSGIDKL